MFDIICTGDDMTYIQKRLYELQDREYAEFQAKLTPTADKDSIIGVRIPLCRKLAKELKNTKEAEEFLNSLPHKYYDENIFHALLLSEIKDIDECINKVDIFLPNVDNWAVCDIMSPKIFKKYPEKVLKQIQTWSKSSDTYTCRFGLKILMSNYLDDLFIPEYLEIPASVKSDEYYINMMITWFFATALAKQWDDTIKLIENPVLDKWTHNKAIQKARESYRITIDQKEYLKSLKIK